MALKLRFARFPVLQKLVENTFIWDLDSKVNTKKWTLKEYTQNYNIPMTVNILLDVQNIVTS